MFNLTGKEEWHRLLLTLELSIILNMRKCIFVVINIILSTTSVVCQDNGSFIRQPHGRNAGSSSVVDTSYIQVYYALCASDIHNDDTYKDYFCFEKGKEIAKFYSYRWVEAEERNREWARTHSISSGSGMRIVPKGKYNGWSEYQYSEWFITKGKLTEYCCFPMLLTRYNSYYEEDYPRQVWTISSDTLRICGYTCQKATCNFGGRLFVAWFTPKIPLKYGPWKFGGLPGLILKVTDKDRIYSFECVKIERKHKPLMKSEYKSYKKMEKKNVLELQRKIHEDIGSLLGDSESRTGKTIHYEPLELK